MGDIKTRFSLEGESQFRSAMTGAANAIKVLNAQQKLAKASFEQTGNAEKYAAAQASILQQKITQQKAAVQAAEQAIKQLSDNGVNPASRQFQQWQTKLYNAQTALTNMETELQNVNGTMQQTTTTAEGTGTAIEAIGKKVNLDAVINGIGKVTGALEAAARKAAQFAREIINFTTDAAKEADDIATDATVYNMTTQEVQRVRYTADILDTSADAIVKSRTKLVKAMQSDSDVFNELGIQIRESVDGDNGSLSGQLRHWEDVFWDLGDALVRIQDEKGFEYVNDQATKLFGKGWEQLRPIFASDWASEDNYLGKAFSSAREYYEAVKASWDVNSDETMSKLTKYDDSIQRLQNNLETLELTVAGELAPGFQKVTDFVGNLLTEFNKYLESDEGKEKMQDLSDAVVNLFKGLEDVDFGAALDTAKSAIDSLKTGLDWINQNGGSITGIIGGLATAFGLLKVSETVLTFVQGLASLKFLLGGGGTAAADAAVAGAAAGASWGGAFAAAVLAAAPWLLSVIAAKAIPEENKLGNEKRVEAAEYSSDEIGRLRQWVELQNELAQINAEFASTGEYDVERFNQVTDAINALGEVQNGDLWSRYWDYLAANNIMPGFDQMPTDFLDNMMKNLPEEPEVPVELTPETSATDIAEEVGPVQLPVQLVIGGGGIGGGGGGAADYLLEQLGLVRHFANGIHSVPYDGMLARLHKGERVMPAREVQSRSYNSNLYVESMYMNNGTDAAGLASAMAAAQRRTMSGFGS